MNIAKELPQKIEGALFAMKLSVKVNRLGSARQLSLQMATHGFDHESVFFKSAIGSVSGLVGPQIKLMGTTWDGVAMNRA